MIGMATKCVDWEYGQRYNEQGEWNPRLVMCDFCGEYYEPEQEHESEEDQ